MTTQQTNTTGQQQPQNIGSQQPSQPQGQQPAPQIVERGNGISVVWSTDLSPNR